MRTDKVKEVSLSRIVAHQEVQARAAMSELGSGQAKILKYCD